MECIVDCVAGANTERYKEAKRDKFFKNPLKRF